MLKAKFLIVNVSKDIPKELPININIVYYKKLKEIATTDHSSLKDYVNQLVVWKFQRDQLREKLYPTLKRISFSDGILFVLDKAKKDTAQIRLINKKLECDIENSNECEHVLFAYLSDDFPDFCKPLID